MYKALIFDLDGTAIPNKPDGMPSENLVEVVTELQRIMRVCAATGRAWFNSKEIIRKLGLYDPCIISGGAQIIEPVTENTLWEKDMGQPQVESIMKVARQFPYEVSLSDDEMPGHAGGKVIHGRERIIYILSVSREDTEVILRLVRQIPHITAHETESWTPGHCDIHITHYEATKNYAARALLKLLNLHKEEVVVAGDSNNDLPLFEIAGYKIAMENGSDEMKAKADLIAPDISEDGLATSLKGLLLRN
jgi:hypothetical protein